MKKRPFRAMAILSAAALAVIAASAMFVPAPAVEAIDMECTENGQTGIAGPVTVTGYVDCAWSIMDADSELRGIANAACAPAKVCVNYIIDAGTCLDHSPYYGQYTVSGRKTRYFCGNFLP